MDDDDVYSFFLRLMVYFLCRLFDGTQVDGINFEEEPFERISSYSGKQPKFNDWLRLARNYGVHKIILEYIRLINIAFGSSRYYARVSARRNPNTLLPNKCWILIL